MVENTGKYDRLIAYLEKEIKRLTDELAECKRLNNEKQQSGQNTVRCAICGDPNCPEPNQKH